VLRTEAATRATGHADRQRHRHLAVGHVAVFGNLVGELIEAHAGEIGEHDLRNRSEPLQSRA
jgi:hypothetical protein